MTISRKLTTGVDAFEAEILGLLGDLDRGQAWIRKHLPSEAWPRAYKHLHGRIDASEYALRDLLLDRDRAQPPDLALWVTTTGERVLRADERFWIQGGISGKWYEQNGPLVFDWPRLSQLNSAAAAMAWQEVQG